MRSNRITLPRAGRRMSLVAAIAMFPVSVAVAGGTPEGVVNASEGIAIGGYDPVAYFELGEPTVGSAAHSFDWDGAEWRFASAEHRDRFSANPERYAPAYGGYCAFAAAENQVAIGDPELWTIHDGRLFLNLNARFQRQFRDDIDANIERADSNWPELRAGLADSTAE